VLDFRRPDHKADCLAKNAEAQILHLNGLMRMVMIPILPIGAMLQNAGEMGLSTDGDSLHLNLNPASASASNIARRHTRSRIRQLFQTFNLTRPPQAGLH
jgi:hypothetical protein